MRDMLSLGLLRLDGGCQPRAEKLLDVIEEYAGAMVQGVEFPPVVVFYDGTDYWLADGYHRRDAALGAGRKEILADIRQGTRRDAILFSVGANVAHGLRRTNEDKRRAVMTLLTDKEWSSWSDREIARRCGVSPDFANRLRPKDTVIEGQYQSRTFVHPKTGNPTTMNTARIGGRPVFDRSDFAQDDPDSRESFRDIADDIEENDEPAPPLILNRDLSAEPERDKSADHIWRGVQAIVEAVKALPSPDVAARQFPRIFAHSVRADDVTAAAEWLAEFAPLWAAGQVDRDKRTAALVEKARGIIDTHVIAS